MTKILYFYPDNPLIINQGNNSRAHSLLLYFKSRNFEVDLVGEAKDNFTQKDLTSLEEKGLITKGHLIRKRKKNGLSYLFMHSIPNRIKNGTKYFNRIGVGQKKDFETILKENKYNHIIISYVLFADFIRNKKLLKNAKVTVDTHDFFTAQFSSLKNFKLGRSFETEMRLLNKFDAIWSISIEEKFIFSQFLPHKEVLTVAHGLENRHHLKNFKPTIDIFYVASNNPHNTNSAKWFFEKVYPLLPKNSKITVVGRVNEVIPDLENVEKITFAKDIDPFYENCKITICPMLTGTGLKIKVVESLAYGIPVVCNERGVDGLLSKINNGCLVSNIPSEFANNIINLLNDDVFYSKQAENAKKFFSDSLDKEIVFKNLDLFFEN